MYIVSGNTYHFVTRSPHLPYECQVWRVCVCVLVHSPHPCLQGSDDEGSDDEDSDKSHTNLHSTHSCSQSPHVLNVSWLDGIERKSALRSAGSVRGMMASLRRQSTTTVGRKCARWESGAHAVTRAGERRSSLGSVSPSELPRVRYSVPRSLAHALRLTSGRRVRRSLAAILTRQTSDSRSSLQPDLV